MHNGLPSVKSAINTLSTDYPVQTQQHMYWRFCLRKTLCLFTFLVTFARLFSYMTKYQWFTTTKAYLLFSLGGNIFLLICVFYIFVNLSSWVKA